jgi:hypothetical protein
MPGSQRTLRSGGTANAAGMPGAMVIAAGQRAVPAFTGPAVREFCGISLMPPADQRA